MPINSYIENIAKRYALGNATEHTFRGDLQHLLEELVPEIAATNEPKRIECGAPDYVVTRKDIPVGYIEAKDVGKDLDAKELKEQFDRYRDALDNLVFTDYLDFRFYINGEPAARVKIGEVRNGKIVALPENFAQFTNLIKEFCSRTPVTIKSSKRLAEMMAEKAKILAYIIKNALDEDIAANVESDLTNQMKAFKDILIHDIDAKAFADIYAQTIAYGMFAARLHDKDLETFSRQEAADKIPKTNPFLRKLFQFIAAFDLDTRIDWIVDALADLFRATDIAAILKNFGKSTQTHDPIMHFYETFLAEYDPKLRKSRGVFYTPEPVVDFIVRAVDDILKSEFNLPNGIADTSKTKVKVDVQGKLQEREVHKVQILDPATGTGTFLATVIKHIYKGFENQQGVWNQYVDEHLIPRLNGFELLMASYAMAHLKLDLLLTELSEEKSLKGTEIIAQGKADGRNPGYDVTHATDPEGVEQTAQDVAPLQGAKTGGPSPGFHPGLLSSSPSGTRDQRFQIYLTNALEEYHPDTGTLFASWLSTEANEANHIKRDTPVMVVIGNPPYSVSSSNKSEWIETLTADYKKDLNERNIQPLSDDYIKFIRYGQHFIEKNGEGVLAYISNNGFIDGLIHRQMRKSLLECFDKIYILDLHGNSKKRETTEDGSLDQNVFDIMQGVSINIFVRTSTWKPNRIGEVRSFDLLGTREAKYKVLQDSSLATLEWKKLDFEDDNFFFSDKDFRNWDSYRDFFSVTELFSTNNAGLATEFDQLTVRDTHSDAQSLMQDLKTLSPSEIMSRYQIDHKKEEKAERAMQTKIERAIRDIKENPTSVVSLDYRPFDLKYTLYTGHSNGFMGRPRDGIMKHMLRENLALLTCRQQSSFDFQHAFISKHISERCSVSLQTSEVNYVFPLYLYSDNNAQPTLDGRTERVPNLSSEIVDKIAAAIGLTFVSEPPALVGGTNAAARPTSDGNTQRSTKTESTPPAYAGGSDMSATDGTFAPIDILDYIYAVLHSPSYREKYKEFLKIDFPRVPYPKDAATFWQLVALGGELRQIHLLESPTVSNFITGFPVGGDNIVEKPAFMSEPGAIATGFRDADTEKNPVATAPGSDKIGRVYFNATQYFSNVPEVAWNFYIGGYQPAQKWLKDRKGRKLSFDDIQHYQKIIVSLTETDRIMTEIDKIDFIE